MGITKLIGYLTAQFILMSVILIGLIFLLFKPNEFCSQKWTLQYILLIGIILPTLIPDKNLIVTTKWLCWIAILVTIGFVLSKVTF